MLSLNSPSSFVHLLIAPHSGRSDSGRSDEHGANLIEYALLIALIALVCVAALIFLGSKPSLPLTTVGSAISR